MAASATANAAAAPPPPPAAGGDGAIPKFRLPLAAVRTLGDPTLRLELHCIAFSHYCTKARWALQLCGLQFNEVRHSRASGAGAAVSFSSAHTQQHGQ